jgi:hypothetical protein
LPLKNKGNDFYGEDLELDFDKINSLGSLSSTDRNLNINSDGDTEREKLDSEQYFNN